MNGTSTGRQCGPPVDVFASQTCLCFALDGMATIASLRWQAVSTRATAAHGQESRMLQLAQSLRFHQL
jgi:hypothetical protein